MCAVYIGSGKSQKLGSKKNPNRDSKLSLNNSLKSRQNINNMRANCIQKWRNRILKINAIGLLLIEKPRPPNQSGMENL